jgi:drug/metabolite transporter (DMT)-like permease
VNEISKIILVMLLWALCFPLITLGLALSPHLAFAALRAVLAGAALVALGLVLGRPMPKEAGIWAILFLVGLGATTLGFLGMFHAAEFISPGIATVIANIQPLLAAVLAGVFLGERVGAGGKTGLLLGFGGIVLITGPQLWFGPEENYAIGVAYILLAAIGITVSNVLIKRIAGEVDAIMAMGIQMLVGGVPLAFSAWVLEDPGNIIWSPLFVLVLVSLSIFGSALVYWLWFSILEKVPLNRANAFGFLIPIFGLSIGVLFYGESVGWLEVGGIGLTLLGIVLVNRTSSRAIEGETVREMAPRAAGQAVSAFVRRRSKNL